MSFLFTIWLLLWLTLALISFNFTCWRNNLRSDLFYTIDFLPDLFYEKDFIIAINVLCLGICIFFSILVT